jgi:hypothetical protein
LDHFASAGQWAQGICPKISGMPIDYAFFNGLRLTSPPLRHNRRSGFAVARVPKVAKIQKMDFWQPTPSAFSTKRL